LTEKRGIRSAAETEVAYTGCIGEFGKTGRLVSVYVERFESFGEGPAVRRADGAVVILQFEEGRLLCSGSVGYRQCSDMAAHGGAY